ncbi:MAG: type IX secretion system sortase PorU [Bacteroidota bacterium]
MQQHFHKKVIKASKVLLLLLFHGVYFGVDAAEIITPVSLRWNITSDYKLQDKLYPQFHTFENAAYHKNKYGALPIVTRNIPISGNQHIQVELRDLVYETLAAGTLFQDKDLLKSEFVIEQELGYIQKNPVLMVQVIPVRINKLSGNIEHLVSFKITIQSDGAAPNSALLAKKAFATNSVLATGEWIKMAINQTGMYALSKNYLKSIGLNTDGIDPRTIKIYGMGGGMLPQKNSDFRHDDLPENAIWVEGESDGVFNEGDRVIFYGKAQQDVWNYSASNGRYAHSTNIYSDVTYYFITYGGVVGKRVPQAPGAGLANTQVTEFDQLYVYEQELYNLIKSGRRWMGEEFSRTATINFTANLGNLNIAEPLYIKSSVTAHSFVPSMFSVSINGNPVINHNLAQVEANFERPYATNTDALKDATVAVSSGSINVTYTYNLPIPGSVGWLDYFELQSRNVLSQVGPMFSFRDSRSVGAGKISQFNISSGVPVYVWDVSAPTQAVNQTIGSSGGGYSFVATSDSLREYISFTGQLYLEPISAAKIPNQNLHGLAAADLFIITHPAFVNESQTLARFHIDNSNLRVHVITVNQIYNEFSSGAQDVSAIRDFFRMFYKRAANPQDLPKYVTLFGRASYDYKNRVSNNTNYVPTYESIESYDPVNTYNSDDYLGLLDDTEGKWDSNTDTKELLDIAIGRLPAQDNTQATNMLNKIFNYVKSPVFGDWKTKLVFVADDEDSNIHQSQAEQLANNAILKFKNYNVKKIFIDAFKEENTAGGARNPDAQAEIVHSVEQGAMIINYTGHGGEVGWAGERILNTDDIQRWGNGNKLPLFVTATCEFSRFDDPSRTSAGEMVLLNPNGGGIALFTTVRLVNSGSNFELNSYFYNRVGLDSASAANPLRLGEIMRLTKNDYLSGDKNERNFTLLGDPAIYLAYPTNRIQTTSINNQSVSITPDTLRAFAKVTISGKFTDLQHNTLSGYTGIVYPTVYDKPSTYRTIGNNPSSPQANFTMQNNVIYRGKASVVNGLFSFSFVVPKDISYEIGYGKISYEGDNGTSDAIGYFNNMIVGTTSDSIPPDNAGPEIKLYMNDEQFVFGGVTNENPTLIVKLKDENGINITGKGVGRDISMILNNNTTKNVVLNDYYQAKTDSYQEGEVHFKMKDLPQGKNMLKTRAYDVYNNSSDAMLEFVVASSQEMALQHVLNYPNPFTTNTTFHFDHNKAGEPITVQVQIFTISGKLIKTLQTDALTNGNHFDQLNWDGRDDYGDNIGKGVYVYKVKVKSNTGKSAEEFQKMVILN